jgi:lipopolysaccharide transport system permease protein
VASPRCDDVFLGPFELGQPAHQADEHALHAAGGSRGEPRIDDDAEPRPAVKKRHVPRLPVVLVRFRKRFKLASDATILRQMTAQTGIDSSERDVVLRIAPRTGWVGVDLRVVWGFRELLYFLVWRDLKVRYRQTVFGVAWAVLQPVLLAIVFSLVLGHLTGIAPAGVAYPAFVLAGLVPWTFFAQGTIGISNSLVNSANLIQKVYFPRLLLPFSAIGSYLLDLAVSIAVLLAVVVVYGIVPTLTFLWLVPLSVLALVASLAIGIWLSALNVRYRDVRYALPFLIQVLLFATPVVYSPDLVPPTWRLVVELNPMVGVVEGFRWAALGAGVVPLESLAISVVVSTLVLLTGLAYFRRVERTFADVI